MNIALPFFIFILVIIIVTANHFYIDVLGDAAKNITSVIIASLEIGIAVLVWRQYNNDQTSHKKYQKKELCNTLNNILDSLSKSYRYNFEDDNTAGFKSTRSNLEKNFLIFEAQTRIMIYKFNETQKNHIKDIETHLTDSYMMAASNADIFLSYAGPCAVTIITLIRSLGGCVNNKDVVLLTNMPADIITDIRSCL